MQLCRIHLASARKASVQPYIFFFAFWEEKSENIMTIKVYIGKSANTWVPAPFRGAICQINRSSLTPLPGCY